MTNKFIQKEIDPKKVLQIYEPNHNGAISFDSILSEEGANILLHSIKSIEDSLLKCKDPYNKKVQQEMQTLYKKSDEQDFDFKEPFKSVLHDFLVELNPLFRNVAQYAEFEKPLPNSVGIHKYSKNSVGISPHKDFSRDVNLITNIILQSRNSFYVCDDREKNNPARIYSPPQSIIFMRANRAIDKEDRRPYHFVEGPIIQDRYNIILRYNTKEENYE
jgi:hypothetical protein